MVDENGNIVRFFVLPSASKQPRFRRRWIEALRRENFHPNRSEFWHAVCSRHFTDGGLRKHTRYQLFSGKTTTASPRENQGLQITVERQPLKGLHLFSSVMIRLYKDK